MRVISTPNAPAAIGPYAQAVESGGLVYCSGQIPLDPATGQLVAGDVGSQARQVLANLTAVLAAAGCDLSDVVKTTIFMTDLDEFATVNDIYAAAFETHEPARATIGVKDLPRGARVEIECIARMRR